MDCVEDIWNRIHDWMKKYAPQMLNLLNPGITEEQLAKLKENVDVNHLPEDFEDSYRIHNGSPALCFFGSVMVNSFYSDEEIALDWVGIKQIYAPENNLDYERGELEYDEIQCKSWSERWIPFGGDRQGNSICIDLDPTAVGNYGQVIQWFSNQYAPILLTSSFTEFLRSFAIDLENAKYALSDNCQNLVYTKVDNE